jgi:anti-sigma B factor antagonist
MEHLWVERRGSLSVVHFGVEYGSCSWDKLEETETFLLRLADDVTPPSLLLDFTNTDYFGSEFINVLVRCHKRISLRRGRFSLCCAQSELMRELETTRLNELWPIYDTRDQAFEGEGSAQHGHHASINRRPR